MKRNLPAIAAAVAASVVLWSLFLFASLWAANFGDAWLGQGRIWPYAHAHLNEEYAEGRFFPLRDSLFVQGALARDLVCFMVGGALASRWSSRPVLTTAVAFLLSISLVHVLSFGLAIPAMREAYFAEGGLALLGITLGFSCICLAALTIAAEGGKADIAKPMHGLGSGVFEIALPFRGDAFRVAYAVQLGEELWVVHAFQKKSKQGAKTPRSEIDLIRERLKKLKEILP